MRTAQLGIGIVGRMPVRESVTVSVSMRRIHDTILLSSTPLRALLI
jgi:hypothetical protein